MRVLRHIVVWSFLAATPAGWLAPLAFAGAWQTTALRATDGDARPNTYDVGGSAVWRPGPAVAGMHPPARAASFSIVDPAPPAQRVRRSVASPATSDRRRIPLYGLFRVYRL